MCSRLLFWIPFILLLSLAGEALAVEASLPDIVGSTHVRGGYYFTYKDYLNEGAEKLLDLRTRVIKVWFFAKRHEYPAAMYKWNSPLWPAGDTSTLVEGAQLPYYQALFNKPFKTYIMCVTSLGRADDYWLTGITEEQKQDEKQQFYELAKYLLTTYQNTGKTFILQHWEGDWMIRGHFDETIDPTQVAISSMIQWLNARQAGVNQARAEVGQHGVWVYHAAEINRVVRSMWYGKPNMVNAVLPYTNLDLVSYSAWDSTAEYGLGVPQVFRHALTYIASNMPDSNDFGSKNVYVGEYGLPENEFSAQQFQQVITDTTESALNWGCPYVVYWQLYCNEPHSGVSLPVKDNNDTRGFWLRKPDGTYSWAWDYFYQMLNKKGDLNQDGILDLKDLAQLTHYWLYDDIVLPVAPDTDNLLVHYKFDEASGTNANDETGRYDGTVNKDGQWLADGGHNGGCLAFDGTVYVNVPPAAGTPSNGKDLSFSCWIYGVYPSPQPSVGTYSWLFGAATSANEYHGVYQVSCPKCGKYEGIVMFLSDGMTWWQAQPNDYSGGWNHYAFVRDGTKVELRVYRNGELVDNLIGGNATIANIASFVIGRKYSGGFDYFGKIDEFRVYDYALSQAEVLHLADKNSGHQTVPPEQAVCDLNEDGVINLKDYAILMNVLGNN